MTMRNNKPTCRVAISYNGRVRPQEARGGVVLPLADYSPTFGRKHVTRPLFELSELYGIYINIYTERGFRTSPDMSARGMYHAPLWGYGARYKPAHRRYTRAKALTKS